MKNYFLQLMALLFGAMIFSQCALDECYNKKAFLENYNVFIDDVSENYKDFSDEVWKKKDEKLKKYMDECFVEHEKDLTREEKTEVMAKSLKYYFKRYGFNIQKYLEDDSELISQTLKDEMKKLGQYSSEELQRIVKEVFQEDLSDIIDKAMDGIENFGEELKKAFESEN